MVYCKLFGTYGINEIKLDSGKRIVYLLGQREGYEIANTPLGSGRVFEKYLVICGEPKRRFLSKKIKTIPEKEQRQIKKKVLEELSKREVDVSRFKDIEFWSSH